MVSWVVSTLVKQKGSWRVSQNKRLPCSPFVFFGMNLTLDIDTSGSRSKTSQGFLVVLRSAGAAQPTTLQLSPSSFRS